MKAILTRKNYWFDGALVSEPIYEPQINPKCHSERSEESRIFKELRSFTAFRMTKKWLLK
jgi:hypothetical protein